MMIKMVRIMVNFLQKIKFIIGTKITSFFFPDAKDIVLYILKMLFYMSLLDYIINYYDKLALEEKEANKVYFEQIFFLDDLEDFNVFKYVFNDEG